MAGLSDARKIHMPERDRDEQHGFDFVYYRTYRIGLTQTLDDANLEEGDTLTIEGSTCVITQSQRAEDEDSKNWNDAKLIEVRAERSRKWGEEPT